ncbi:MAG: ribbon-helix-helix domain-containing protein [Terriglobia bacterium]
MVKKVLLPDGAPMTGTTDVALSPRYVRIGTRMVTFHLEARMWDLLSAIAERQNLTADALCSEIAEAMLKNADLATAIRCYVLGLIVSGEMPVDLVPAELRDLIENPPTIQ